MRALLRWTRADLRSHRVPSLLVVLATAGTVAALLLAGTLLGAAFDPWQRDFAASGAPQVRIDAGPAAPGPGDPAATGPDLGSLARLPGVTAVTVQQRTADTTLIGRLGPAAGTTGSGDRIPLVLRADAPDAARPRLLSGTWLSPANGSAPGPAAGALPGLVLERSAAEAAWARPGDRLTLQITQGRLLDVVVTGVADSPDQVSYPAAGYALGWVLPATLDRVQPDPVGQGRTIGLKLADPGNADYVAQSAVNAIGSDQVVRISTWLEARASQEQDSRLTGLLLGLSGLAALLAAALAVAGAAAGRIRARTGDIALLKALGFTPRQVVRMFVIEHLLLAGTGTLLGAGLAVLLAPGIGGESGPLPLGPTVLGVVTGIALGVIGVSVALPAYRAARVLPIPPGDGIPGARSPRPARLGALRRFPPAVVLGLSTVLRHRGSSSVTVLRLAVPVFACTLALSTWATLDAVGRGGQGSATHSVLTVRLDAGAAPQQSAELPERLGTVPGVAGVYPSAELQALAPGQSATLTLRALGTTAHPFPFTIAEGRGIEATDEAVAGQAALDLLNVRVGQWVRITTGSTPRILHIVGRNLEPDLDGRIISTSWDTLDRPDDGTAPAFYSLVLRPGSDPDRIRAALPAVTGLGSALDVRPSPDAAAGLTGLRGSVIGLVALLALIATAELLTTAASGIRDHRHDLGLLRAIGLTPRQAGATMGVRGAALALCGVLLGVVLGIPLAQHLINLQGRDDGIGSGIAHAPSLTAVLILAAVTTLAAGTTSAVPALRTARTATATEPR
ncbi:FtsX-like permease family protein [Streptacidiphilus sp. EB129]|uniref:ABC transporter permease n=1 Tax=Streptacidiphilus sp. EB129 TaxID=3156262 RepID=UPI00351827C3